MTQELRDNHNWDLVENALKDGSFSGFKMAIIESEKIFQQTIKNSGFKKSVILKEISKITSEPEQFYRARSMAEKIIFEENFEISREDAKKIIAGYWRGIQDLSDWLEGLGWFDRNALKTRNIFNKKIFTNIAIALFSLMIFIKLTSNTEIGQNAIASLIYWNDFLFWKVTIAAGSATLVFIGFKIGILYFRLRKQNL